MVRGSFIATFHLLVFLALAKAAGASTPEFVTIEQDGFRLSYRVRVEQGQIDLKVSCQTTGWVGVGFDPDVKMKGANLILGYVDASGVHVQDSVGVDKGKLESDVKLGGTDDVTEASGTEADGRTEIAFTYPLASKDPFDHPIDPAISHRVMLACGKDGQDNFTTKHARAILVEVKP